MSNPQVPAGEQQVEGQQPVAVQPGVQQQGAGADAAHVDEQNEHIDGQPYEGEDEDAPPGAQGVGDGAGVGGNVTPPLRLREQHPVAPPSGARQSGGLASEALAPAK